MYLNQKTMNEKLNRAVIDLINDIQKQLGKDDPVARYIRTAVFAKLTRDKTKAFIKRDNDKEKKMIE